MKFSILQQDLWPGLQAVARSCNFRSQLPVLGNILIQADKDQLKLSATNLEIGIVKILKAEVSENGELTIPAKTFTEIVANLAGEKIDFISKGDVLEVFTPSFSSKITGISAVEFPMIPLSGQEAATFEAKTLLKSLPQVSFCAAVDDGRPILTGVLTEIKNGQLQFVATDGYRLGYKKIPVSKDIYFKALIPRRTLEEVVRVISEEDMDDVHISISEDLNQVVFDFPNTKLSSRLVEGQFPSWEKILPQDPKARIVVDKNELLKAVKLASVFARNEANVIKMQNLSTGKLIFTSEAKEVGDLKKDIDAQVEGEEIQIAFNNKFLLDVLSVIGTSQIIIELSGSLSAALFKPMGEEGLQYIIMPVNLS